MSGLSNLPPGCTQADIDALCLPNKCDDCAISECCEVAHYECPGPYTSREQWIIDYPEFADFVIGHLLVQVEAMRHASE